LQTKGDGFHGTGSFEICSFFGPDSTITNTIRMHDLIGPGEPASVDLSRPRGAN
jgi:hypothetical protein